MLNKQANILEHLAKEPWKRYTFTELFKISKTKSRSYLSLTLNRFVEDNIIAKELVGRIPVYSLNIASAKARVFAGFVLEYTGWRKRHILHKDMEKIMTRIPTKGYVFIITGSYAKNKQVNESDIDTVVIVDDSVEVKSIYAELAHVCEMNIPPVHLYVFRNNEFLEMLLSRQANYGKEIAGNNLILAGGEIYMNIIMEAMQNGFTGKNTY